MRFLRSLKLLTLKKSSGGSLQHLQQQSHYCTGYDGNKRGKNQEEREDPAARTIRVLKGDMRRLKNNFIEFFGGPLRSEEDRKTDKEIFSDSFDQWQDHCDVAIIGGGIIGSSIAYWIKQRVPKGLHVVVIEKDPTYATAASTTFSCGGLRQQFSLSENIQMSQFGAQFLREASRKLHVEGHDPPNIKFTPQGYLFLASESGAEQLNTNFELQSELGVKNILLTAKQLKQRFPWLNTEDIALGCLGLENEGWFDPSALLEAFKRKCISLGTKYVQGEAVGFSYEQQPDLFMEGVESGTYESLRNVLVQRPNGDVKPLKFGLAVLACGPNSGNVAELAGLGKGQGLRSVPLPVEPRKRYVYSVQCPGGPGLDLPCLVDPTGAYIRRDGFGGNYICGRSPPEGQPEPSIGDFEVDHEFFKNHVGPQLAHRVPTLEAMKIESAWAGHYDYNYFDQNAIVGCHPYYNNLFIASGFSGHGLQHAPAVGRAVMEVILDSSFRTIDLSIFSYDRLLLGNKILERNII